jgi:hypothetical protein
MPHTTSHLNAFAPPGAFDIASAAMRLARSFLAEARISWPEADWIVAFDWADSRRFREKGSASVWHDLGAGFDIAAFDRKDVPSDAIHFIDGTELLIKIPESVWKTDGRRIIDVSANDHPTVIWR